MRQVKYIIFDFEPVLFPDSITHKDVVRGMGSCNRKPTGAGFYDVPSGLVYGESVSLGMGPGKNDQAIIRKFLGRE